MDDPNSIKELFNELRAGRGDCPTADELLQFQQQALPLEQLVKLKQHIEGCGVCDSIIAGLKEFDLTVTEKPKLALNIRQFFLRPAVAYVIALALLYPAYVGIFRKPEVVEKKINVSMPAQTVGSVQNFDLGEGINQRSGTASNASDHIIRIAAAEEFIILNFFVPVRPDRRYEMQINDDNGKKIAAATITARDQLGNFSVICPHTLFSGGNYLLTVRETDQSAQQV